MNMEIIIRRIITSTLILGCCYSLSADVFDDYVNRKNQEWENTMKKYSTRFEGKRKEYNTAFEKKRIEYNARFLEYLAKPWGTYQLNKPEETIGSPKPDVIIPAEKKESIEIIQPKDGVEIIELSKEVVVDLTIREISEHASHVVNYYGSQLKVELTKDYAVKFKVTSDTEKAVSKALSDLLNDAQYLRLIDNCVALKSQYNMCDWGYVVFTDKLAKSYFGEAKCNESIVFRAFLLTQTGYDVRIGKSDKGLELLVYSKDEISDFMFVQFPYNSGNRRYYLITGDENIKYINTYRERFSEVSKSCDMTIRSPQVFASTPTPNKDYNSHLGLSVTASTNKNLMDFYDDYPHCDWTVYAVSGMSRELNKQVVDELRRQILGLEKIVAVEQILNFVQTAFPYIKDSIQFKCERPLFPDETFYYPGSDCEDHAILFAYLIEELVGLDVIFLYYGEPGPHLSTAIKINDERIKGDAILYEGERYMMCDPTIGGVGAGIGVQARECKNRKPKCYKIKFR